MKSGEIWLSVGSIEEYKITKIENDWVYFQAVKAEYKMPLCLPREEFLDRFERKR